MTVFTGAFPHRLDDPDLGRRFLRLAGDGDEQGAIEVVTDLLTDGVEPRRVIIELIARTQARVGELWATDQWSIAREHAATAVSERALATVAALAAAPHPSRDPGLGRGQGQDRGQGRGRVTVACVDGEWHALPVRILAEVLRLDGWRVDFLGASVPVADLVTHLRQTSPQAVALSCTVPTRLPQAHAAITACRAAGTPVIVGGRGFGPDGARAERLGADAWAAGAAEAATLMATNWPPRAREAPVREGRVAPASEERDAHVRDDDEYAYVVRHRRDLVGKGVRRLVVAYPPMADYDQRQLEATTDDMGSLLDFLAAALYCGDSTVFSDLVEWTAGVLGARGMPPEILKIGLLLYRDQLRDYPSSLAMINEGLTRLGR